MSDRQSPEIFRAMFKLLASDPTPQHREWANQLWHLTDQYDFTPCNMYCDEELAVLGLARKGYDPDYPESPPWVYGPEKAKQP